jgi:hypothetical protein
MKSNEVRGIVNDLLHLGEDFNPMYYIWVKRKFELDLITEKKSQAEIDSLTKFYDEKIKWFKERIKKLNGDLKDFQKAKIIVFGAKEKIEIIYKDKEFSGEQVYKWEESDSNKEFLKEMRKQKRENAGLE